MKEPGPQKSKARLLSKLPVLKLLDRNIIHAE